MSEDRAIRALAVAVEMLSYNGSDSHGDANKAVMIDADPDDVEPRQP